MNFQSGNEVILSPQTLQQITGSPGRARDRNRFHLPTENTIAAVSLALLRGYLNSHTLLFKYNFYHALDHAPKKPPEEKRLIVGWIMR